MRDIKKCRKCSQDIPKQAQICVHCGAEQKTSRGTIIIIIALVVLVFIIFVSVMSGSRDSGGRDSGSSPTSSHISSAPQMSKEEYISRCSSITYEELARNPEKHRGRLFTFDGEVIQVSESAYGDTVSLRINVTQGEYFWTDTIFATVEIPAGSDRILEGDILTIYGECCGLYTYTSVIGSSVSLPKIEIEYFTIH